ncbi:MAG: hypothetical protein HQL55_16625 [Magnetococcales bacterium]|nr:hypothetical protein [Magnetococcales bacterium]
MNESKNRKVVIVGTVPGRDSDPSRPLVPIRRGQGAAASLLRLMQIDPCSFEVIFERHYIIPVYAGRSRNGDRFPKAMAIAGVEKLIPLLHGRTVVLIGKKTASAFGIGHVAPCTWDEQILDAPSGDHRPTTIAWVPTPCGINLWWNDPMNKQAGEAFLVALAQHAFDLSLRGLAA